jgi:hypothetical protein
MIFLLLVTIGLNVLAILYSSKIIAVLADYITFVEESPVKGFLIIATIYIIWVPLMLPSNIPNILIAHLLWKLYGTLISIFVTFVMVYICYIVSSLISF